MALRRRWPTRTESKRRSASAKGGLAEIDELLQKSYRRRNAGSGDRKCLESRELLIKSGEIERNLERLLAEQRRIRACLMTALFDDCDF